MDEARATTPPSASVAASEAPPRVPTWVKVLGGLLLLAVLAFVSLHLLTGGAMRH